MFKKRITELRKQLQANKFDAFLVSSAVNIEYLTGYPNFSRDEREAYLFITKNSAILFTDSRYIEAVEKIVPKEVIPVVNKPLEIINQMVKNQKLGRVGIENNFTYAEYKKFRSRVPNAKLVLPKEPLVETLRSIKDGDEIKAIKKAANLTHSTLTHILPNIKPGVTEKEIAWEMEKFIRQGGGVLAFDTIVAFGPHSSIPHHATSNQKLTTKDQFILLDFGAKVDGYCSDMSRTLLTKNASKRAQKMYTTVLTAQKEAEKVYDRSYKSGKKIKASDGSIAANNILTEAGFEAVPHGLGHGIGLEVHEEPHLHPKSEDILVSGNYFSIEPGIYIEGFGGVRIEDDYLITEKGLEQTTLSPKELNEIILAKSM